jgi:hypothetical protein
MTARGTVRAQERPPAAHALLAAALLAATALVRVPTELYRASARDFASASRDLLLTILLAGLLVFALLALAVTLLPARARKYAGPLLVGLAVYGWIRAGFFPGPSVNLDGSRLTVDLSTGLAGVLAPVLGGVFLAWLGTRQRRVVTTLLAALLAGALVQWLGNAISTWRSAAPASREAVVSTLEWSRSGNVLILVLDSLQSDVFEDVLEAEPLLRERLDGFRYYRLASSSGPTTYLSLPTIHSGTSFKPGESVAEFYHASVNEGSVLNRFAAAGYRTSYALAIGGCPKAVASCLGTIDLARSRVEVAVQEASRLLDLGVYRILPDRLREAILRNGRGPVVMMTGRAHLLDHVLVEAAALGRLASTSTVTDSPPAAKMIHSTITHLPAVLQPDCSPGERRHDREGARLQAQCAFRQITALLERLQAGGAYDVSNIVVLADHGYGMESRFVVGTEDPNFQRMVGAFNPVVLVKPAMARGPLTTSDAPIELADVARALCAGAVCSPAAGLRRLDAVDPGRTRNAFWYTWKNEYWSLQHIPGIQRYWIRGDLTSIKSWSREAAAYAPGTVIEFRRGGNLGRYVGFGWGHRQRTHTWMVDAQATVWLRGRFEPGRDYLLVVEAQPGDASPRAPKRVAVEVNSMEVGEVATTDPTPSFETYRFLVPSNDLSRFPNTLICFSAKARPNANGDPSEARLAVKTVEFRPLP